MKLERTNYSSGAPLEPKVGYSRMVKKGPLFTMVATPALNRPTQFVEIELTAITDEI